MADIRISPVGYTVEHGSNNKRIHGMVWVSSTIGYVFWYRDAEDLGLFYQRTTDGGLTWDTPVQINTTGGPKLKGFAIWYDKWTPSNTGDKIHIGWGDCTGTSIGARCYYRYRYLDASTNSLSSTYEVTNVSNGSGLNGGWGMPCRARNGNLFYLFWTGSIGGTNGFYKSVNEGVSWSSRSITGLTFGSTIYSVRMFPSPDQTDDVCCIWPYSSATALLHYDDSANTWASTQVESAVTNCDAITLDNGNTICVYTYPNTGTLRCIDVTDPQTYVQRTNVYTSESGHTVDYAMGICKDIDENIGVAFAGESETVYRVGGRYSYDLGVAWSEEGRVDESGTCRRGDTTGKQYFTDNKVFVTWFDSDVLWGNFLTIVRNVPSPPGDTPDPPPGPRPPDIVLTDRTMEFDVYYREESLTVDTSLQERNMKFDLYYRETNLDIEERSY